MRKIEVTPVKERYTGGRADASEEAPSVRLERVCAHMCVPEPLLARVSRASDSLTWEMVDELELKPSLMVPGEEAGKCMNARPDAVWLQWLNAPPSQPLPQGLATCLIGRFRQHSTHKFDYNFSSTCV
ncbi:unnamed protein product [Caenorhabditis auriculariae]|uniref:Uncharacterized protein n=1 Tax=Caenorhabditis auriculariae TaxID=2777116 RepID=A0A8S1HK79_9PELO|nr:unnamed protein product [Caenorhabditis auriculariae]